MTGRYFDSSAASSTAWRMARLASSSAATSAPPMTWMRGSSTPAPNADLSDSYQQDKGGGAIALP